MNKRIVLTAVALSAASMMFAGGTKETAPETSGATQKVVTTVCRASYADEQWYTTMNADFEKETGIHVDVTPTPGNDDDHDAKVNVDLLAGGTVDVVESLGPKNFTIRNEGKFFMPLKDLVANAGVDATALWGANLPVDKNGEYYGIPFKQEMWCVYYNKDIFDAAGVPYPSGSWTWDEYVATAKKLTDKTKGIYGSFMQSDTQYMYLPACQKKVPFYKADGTCNFDDPEFSKAISWYKNLSASDGIQMSVSDLNVENASWNYYALAGDHLAMFMQGNWFVRLLNSQKDYPRNWKYGITQLPSAGPEGNTNLVSQGYVSVNKNAAHPKEALTYALWIAQNQWKYEGGIPALAKLTPEQQNAAFSSVAEASDGQVSVDELYNALLNNGMGVTDSDIVGPSATEYNSIVKEEVSSYCMDLQSLDDTITHIVTRVNEAIKNAQ